jgi:hypothetical protein
VAEALPAEPAAPAAAEPAATRQMEMNRVLPILAAVLLGLLALAIAAAVMLRRRRARREELYDEQVYAEPEAMAAPEPAMTIEPAPEPAFVAAPAAAPVAATSPLHDQATSLPEGFDLSRFGRHVQAAYRGPTPDNPSLSLKHRLRKANALDQRERANQADGEFMLAGDSSETTPSRAYSE